MPRSPRRRPRWPASRSVLLTAAFLSGCAAGGTPGGGAGNEPTGAFGPYLAGRFAASQADAATASAQFGAALDRDPDQPELVAQAFGAAVMNGNSDAPRLARRLPADQLAELLLAGSDAQAGRWERAETRLRNLPRRGSAQILQPLLIAWTQAGRGNTDNALALLRPFIEDPRLRGLASLHAAMIADLANRPAEALRNARAAVADAPAPNLRLVQIVAGIMARAGQEAEGARLFDTMALGQDDIAIVATPAVRQNALRNRAVASATEGMAEAEVTLGATLRNQGAPELGLMLARLALRLRPDFTPATLLAAESLADQNHPEAALPILDTVRANDPLAPLVALRRASLLDSMGRTADAEALLRQLAASRPDATQPLARLGDMLRAHDRFAEATAAYEQAQARLTANNGNGWSLHYSRGITLERQNRWPEAEAAFQQALRLSPDQPYVLNYLAYTWAERGERLPEARAMLERAAKARPNDGNIADSLGWVMFRQGDLPGAVKALERAAEIDPRNAEVNDHLGDAYWAVNRRSEARFQWRRALDLKPSAEAAARLETKLRDGLPAPATTAAR